MDLAYASIFIPSLALVKKMHAGETAQRVKTPATKPTDSSSIPETYAVPCGKYRNTSRWN